MAPHLQETQVSQKPLLRAVLFDFDATLTVREELQMWRLFPEHSGFAREIDVSWLREKGFGGSDRIASLGTMLQTLAESGAELHIVSYADREVIVRALAILGALHFFCDRIVGWQELGGPMATKGAFIKELMARRSWQREEVLFVDDQDRNIREAAGLCLTHRTRGCGLSPIEMGEILKEAISGRRADPGTAADGTFQTATRWEVEDSLV